MAQSKSTQVQRIREGKGRTIRLLKGIRRRKNVNPQTRGKKQKIQILSGRKLLLHTAFNRLRSGVEKTQQRERRVKLSQASQASKMDRKTSVRLHGRPWLRERDTAHELKKRNFKKEGKRVGKAGAPLDDRCN